LASSNPSTSVMEFVVEIAQRLRAHGVKCGASESVDALTAVRSIEIRSIPHLREVLRLTMVKRLEDYPIFDMVFEELLGIKRRSQEKEMEMPGGEGGQRSSRERLSKSTEDKTRSNMTFYSPMEVLTRREIPSPTRESLREVKRVVKRMKRRLALLPGRRMARSLSGDVDFPLTFRKSLETFGEPMYILRTRRKITRCRLVALFDVSGSMDTYTKMLMQSMYALARQGAALEVFVFSTRLMRVTDLLRYFGPEAAARKISTDVDIWGSGTRIGSCLKSFLDKYGGILTRGTVVMIVSDGWDTGEPELLDKVMRELKNRSGRIVWINPHVDKPGFRPRTIGMETAMPYIDLLAGISALQNIRSYRKYFGIALDPISRKSRR